MPDMARIGHYVFRILEHVGAGCLETVFWKKITNGVLVGVRQPGLLEEDDNCSGVGEEVGEVMLVSPQSLNVEREQ